MDSNSTNGIEALCNELDQELKGIGSGLDFFQNKRSSYADQLNWRCRIPTYNRVVNENGCTASAELSVNVFLYKNC